MRILSLKPGHDGAIASIVGETLVFSIEAEKDSHSRFSTLNTNLLVSAGNLVDSLPDVLAIGGWDERERPKELPPINASYWGLTNIESVESSFMGKPTHIFTSSHERSHLMSAYALSPWPQGTECYALVWEGRFGAFYHVDKYLNWTKLSQVLDYPGLRYILPYQLADESVKRFKHDNDSAGKIMALAAYEDDIKMEDEYSDLIDMFLSPTIPLKEELANSPLFQAGTSSPLLRLLSKQLSDQIVSKFLNFARENFKKKLPLLISGGCGLNCDWNSRIRRSELFEGVFIPPCCNDSGSAIGTAVDALFHFTGNAKLKWDVYGGSEFYVDQAPIKLTSRKLNISKIADKLFHGEIIAWVQGRAEIGPRALGNRSLLAAPFDTTMKDKLNKIKQRERYRPIAPVCREDDVDVYFDIDSVSSPYMLYLAKVLSSRLKAVTHVDGSARLQTVNNSQNPRLYDLLTQFNQISGIGVLCNTSLNFKGYGFINRSSDLAIFCRERNIRTWVINDQMYTTND